MVYFSVHVNISRNQSLPRAPQHVFTGRKPYVSQSRPSRGQDEATTVPRRPCQPLDKGVLHDTSPLYNYCQNALLWGAIQPELGLMGTLRAVDANVIIIYTSDQPDKLMRVNTIDIKIISHCCLLYWEVATLLFFSAESGRGNFLRTM